MILSDIPTLPHKGRQPSPDMELLSAFFQRLRGAGAVENGDEDKNSHHLVPYRQGSDKLTLQTVTCLPPIALFVAFWPYYIHPFLIYNIYIFILDLFGFYLFRSPITFI